MFDRLAGDTTVYRKFQKYTQLVCFVLQNTFQCILASDGFLSYIIFLYGDGLIYPRHCARGIQIGLNAGDGINFEQHEYGLLDDVVNITNSSIPEETVMVGGMLVYRGFPQELVQCVDDGSGELHFNTIAKIIGSWLQNSHFKPSCHNYRTNITSIQNCSLCNHKDNQLATIHNYIASYQLY